MKKRRLRLFACAAAIGCTLTAVNLSADAADGSSALDCAECCMDYDLNDDLTVIFQKMYAAYNITAFSAQKADYAEITMRVIRPFTFFQNGMVSLDSCVATTTITLPLLDNYYTYMFDQSSFKMKAGDVLRFSTTFYNKSGDQKVTVPATPGSYISFCGCDDFTASGSPQTLYLSGFSSAEAEYADITVNVNRKNNDFYSIVESTTSTVSLDKSHGCIKFDPSQLNFQSGDLVSLSYTFYNKSGNAVSDIKSGTQSALLSTKPGVAPGDINGDGTVSKTDIISMQNFLANAPENKPVTDAEICLRTADLNRDGRITCKDLTILKNIMLIES